LSARLPSSSLAVVPEKARGLLLRMFADPYLLEKNERADLAGQLRECVNANPQVSELRVLFGMALCVNFEVPDAIEELRQAVRLDPDNFIAHLKMGELWMRLRVMDKAEEHTQRAGRLAGNRTQSELARRQGASIRAMKHAGIERGGYKSPFLAVTRTVRRLWKRDSRETLATVDAS
jgi:tetratricopeptide (TPR) repeat protein